MIRILAVLIILISLSVVESVFGQDGYGDDPSDEIAAVTGPVISEDHGGDQEQSVQEPVILPPDRIAIDSVRNYITSSGSTINQALSDEAQEGVYRNVDGMMKKFVYTEPLWTATKVEGTINSYEVRCFQTLTVNVDDVVVDRGVRVLKWYYDGYMVYAIPPNALDSSMPVWTFSK